MTDLHLRARDLWEEAILWAADTLGVGSLGVCDAPYALESVTIDRARGGVGFDVLGLCGPGGVGKDALLGVLSARMPIMPLVFDTTRPPRPGEQDGVCYNFLDQGDFARNLRLGLYCFARVIAGRGSYGLRRAQIDRLGSVRSLAIVKEAPLGLQVVLQCIAQTFLHSQRLMVCLIPPPPFHEHLLQRLDARDGLHAPPTSEDDLKRQVQEFRDFIDLLVLRHRGIILVNDNLFRAADIIHRMSSVRPTLT